MKKIAIVLCAIMLINSIPVFAADASNSKSDMPVVVSLGDSYSSGEGVQPYYGQKSSNKYTCEDWIAHRSTLAWSGLLQYNGIYLNTVRAQNPCVSDGLTVDSDSCKNNGSWYFTAVSGAVTKDIISMPYVDKNGETKNSAGQAKEVQKTVLHKVEEYTLNLQIDTIKAVVAKKQDIDYITMTIGGNDVGFVDILTKAVLTAQNPSSTPVVGAVSAISGPLVKNWTVPIVSNLIDMSNLKNQLVDVLESFWDDASDSYSNRLKQTYAALLAAATDNTTLVIAGYPQLLHINEDGSGNGMLFSYEESRLIDSAVVVFNDYLATIVKNMEKNRKKTMKKNQHIIFVDVMSYFQGHEAYSDDPYINGLVFGFDENINLTPINSASFHPNDKGVRAYADAVQDALAKIDSGFEKTCYNTNSQLEIYDSNGKIYDNYTVKVEGKEYKNIVGTFDFGGLWQQDFQKTFTATAKQPLSLKLPKGDYTFTITDNSDANKTISKQIKIRDNIRNTKITIMSNFGQLQYEETGNGHYDDADVLADAVEYNGHWYKIIKDESITSWDAAKQYCNNFNGYLATITSQAENDFLYNYITACGYENAYFGLTDHMSEGIWQWDNGEEVMYTNWHQNEPNNETSNEDYAMFYYKYPDGTWNDGSFGTETNNGGKEFICEWGEYQSSNNIGSDPISTTSSNRDIVLVLDVSGSMAGTPMIETKKAATNFISTILKEDASIGIVTYDDSATKISDFSTNEEALKTLTEFIDDGGSTNIEDGLQMAKDMLSTSKAEKKIIVLMSDGMPNRGREGDDLIAFADSIKDTGTYIYTLGFFESAGSSKSAAQLLMEKIASDGCHYEVADADDLVFFFGDMADQINGQKFIYVRIACPVDVTVTYLGESLSSSEKNFNDRTSFGSLSLEDIEDSDNKIKTLRLKEGKDYAIKIEGTGRGKMDYTIGYMDDSGQYSDMRNFRNIEITRRTVIDTSTKYSDETILNVDEDGDGKYDLKFRAGANEYGELVDYTYIIYIALGVVGVIAVLITVVIIRKKLRKRKAV